MKGADPSSEASDSDAERGVKFCRSSKSSSGRGESARLPVPAGGSVKAGPERVDRGMQSDAELEVPGL